MKKLTCKLLAAAVMLSCLATTKAATVTVTVADDGVSNIGANGTFYWALTNCSPGDTIAFNIPGAGPHYLQEPPTGFPLIYKKHRITIDGYSQPGSLANTNPITGSNSAQIKIVIDGRNGNGRDMNYLAYDGTLAKSDPPIDNSSMAGEKAAYTAGDFSLLTVYRSTNVTIKGLAFLADGLAGALVTGKGYVFGLVFLHDYGLDPTVKDALEYNDGSDRNGHVAGCWFGVDPADPTKGSVVWCATYINFPRHQGDNGSPRPELPSVGLTIGVGANSTNPRAEFNVIVGGAALFTGDPLRLRVSGNFLGFMPDGVTPYDFSSESPTTAYIWNAFTGFTVEIGRYGENYASSPTEAKPMVIGTDGDGVNDADEGNLWSPIGGAFKTATPTGGPVLISAYRSGKKTWLVGGNRWGIGNDGTIWPNSAFFMQSLYLSDNSGDGPSKIIIGSDFATNRSPATIAAQANYFYNNLPIGQFGNPPSVGTGKVVPFLYFEHPNATEPAHTNACLSLRGNVMAGNGLAPFDYANNSGSLLAGFTNFYSACLDTNGPIIPALNAGSSVFPHLVGTFARGVYPYTNVIIDIYQLDPYGWANGQQFGFSELIPALGVTNGFPQGKRYIGSFPVTNTGSFDIALPPLTDLGDGRVTVTANYSVSPAGTPLANTMTSDFSMPITIPPHPYITMTQSGGNLILSWNPENGSFTVQTNSSVTSPGTWGNFTAGNVAPPVSVPIGSGTRFVRLKK